MGAWFEARIVKITFASNDNCSSQPPQQSDSAGVAISTQSPEQTDSEANADDAAGGSNNSSIHADAASDDGFLYSIIYERLVCLVVIWTVLEHWRHLILLARDVIFTSRAYTTMSVSVCLSVTFVHCGHRVQWILDIFACLDRWMSLLLTDNASPGLSDGMMPGFLVEEGRGHLVLS